MKVVHKYEDIIAEKYKVIDILGQGGSGTTYAVLTNKRKLCHEMPIIKLGE